MLLFLGSGGGRGTSKKRFQIKKSTKRQQKNSQTAHPSKTKIQIKNKRLEFALFPAV